MFERQQNRNKEGKERIIYMDKAGDIYVAVEECWKDIDGRGTGKGR
jgi:hypothetical protein